MEPDNFQVAEDQPSRIAGGWEKGIKKKNKDLHLVSS